MKIISSISLIFLTSTLFGVSLNKKPISSSLIVYNGNIALVHEKRQLKLKKSDKQIIYRGVASTIETDSVNISLPNSITLFSQQYRFDKLTMQKLLDAHIGKKIKVARKNFTLLSHNANYAIVKNKNNEIISILTKDIIFKTIPNSLITKPSLVWNIKTNKNINSSMEINYLIKNISFKSDYILNIHQNTADLNGWITIDNRSGKTYKDTTLHVLAGDINRVNKPIPNKYRYNKVMATMQDTPSVSQKAYEGYHFYSIPFKVNLANNEKTQIKFITKNSITIKRKYNSTMSSPLYFNSEIIHSVTQYIQMQKLEFPLPKGVVRTYSKFQEQKIFLGESTLKHTPKNTPIKLTIGKNFDFKVKESIIKRVDNKNYLDATILYTLKNDSNEKKEVEILIPFNKDIKSSIRTTKPYKYKNANQVSFIIIVDANKTQKFKVNFRSKR